MIALVSWSAFAAGVLIGFVMGATRDPRRPA